MPKSWESELEEPDSLIESSDAEIVDVVKRQARVRLADAFSTYDDVMHSSDDDRARIAAADKMVSLAGADSVLVGSLGISEEAFQAAFIGMAHMAGAVIAGRRIDEIIRNVTPEKAPPEQQERISVRPAIDNLQEETRKTFSPQFEDDSPLSRVLRLED